MIQEVFEENIPIRDIRTIAETLAEHGSKSQDADILTGMVRIALGRLIVQQINGMEHELPVITLDPVLEQLLHQSIQSSDGMGGGVEPGLAERLHSALQESAQKQELAGQPAILLVSAALRSMLARFVRHTISSINVLSYNEIPTDKQIKIIATVGQPNDVTGD